MQYVLASASPRRRELLSQILNDFIVDPAVGGEEVNISFFPEDIACALAERKCDEVFSRHSGSTVIGCDTIVVFEGEVLGKPKDRDDAAATLRRLSGKTHFVITGVCVRNKYKKLVKYDKTEVKFNLLSEAFIKTNCRKLERLSVTNKSMNKITCPSVHPLATCAQNSFKKMCGI